MANKNVKELTRVSFDNISGKIIYNMTNDYMFRAVLQKNTNVLRGLVASILGLNPKNITVTIVNPIELGENIDSKDFILDIKVLINGRIRLNLEMQVVLKSTWEDRSLGYLCRTFVEDLEKGDDYIIAPAIQVSFIDFSLHKDNPEFFATYMLQNIKNGKIYSDNFKLFVVELNQIHLATDEDKTNGIDQWAALFKAQTWEELKALTKNNEYLSEAAQTMYLLSADKRIIEQCRRRREVELEQKYFTTTIADQQAQLVEQRNQLAQKDSQLAQKDSQLAQMSAEIAALKARLQNRNN